MSFADEPLTHTHQVLSDQVAFDAPVLEGCQYTFFCHSRGFPSLSGTRVKQGVQTFLSSLGCITNRLRSEKHEWLGWMACHTKSFMSSQLRDQIEIGTKDPKSNTLTVGLLLTDWSAWLFASEVPRLTSCTQVWDPWKLAINWSILSFRRKITNPQNYVANIHCHPLEWLPRAEHSVHGQSFVGEVRTLLSLKNCPFWISPHHFNTFHLFERFITIINVSRVVTWPIMYT